MAGHDYWHTPPELFAALDDEFHFDLDAACTAENALCSRVVTEADDAMKTPWLGQSVWCNPPYSQMANFVRRGWQQCQEQKITVVLLIPAYTDPGYWWDTIVPHADEIRFLRGRVSFLEHGQSRTSARFPSVIIVFRWRRGETRGFPRVFWWDWKVETDPAKIAPLFTATGEPQALDAVDPHAGIRESLLRA